jgi:hypothetical protein
MLKVEPLTLVSDVSDNVAPVDWLPRMLHEFSEIQRHVLARAAMHSLRFDGKIPYIPPTPLHRDIAFSLADVRLLTLTSKRPAFSLSRLGLLVVHRLFRIVPARWVIEREIEFEFMRALMRNHWETH